MKQIIPSLLIQNTENYDYFIALRSGGSEWIEGISRFVLI